MGQITAYYWTQMRAAPMEVSVAMVDISVSLPAARETTPEDVGGL